MDPRFSASAQDLHSLQMEVKQVQLVQNNHSDRISRIEKRHLDDANLKSVWNSPFPGVLSGTPQHGPASLPGNDDFALDDDNGTHLLNSLHLGAAVEDEPARRGGAASRANSVRFDESALQGSGLSGQNNRHSGDFGPIRPGSGLMMERSLSHKSDGRHSSAGHSVHSVHSATSGRASSLGIDTNFIVGSHDEDSPVDIPEPPPSFFVLGSVPSIIRCWLTENFAHSTLLYADVCTGSQKSVVEYSLLKELDLLDEVEKGVDGVARIQLHVYLAEAIVTQVHIRAQSPGHRIPYVTTTFEVLGSDQVAPADAKKGIRIFLGSETLRAQSADVLLSQNIMTLYSGERDKLSVPFVRPEDDSIFKYIRTASIEPEKTKLNASAAPFISSEIQGQRAAPPEPVDTAASNASVADTESQDQLSPFANTPSSARPALATVASENGGEGDGAGKDAPDPAAKESSTASSANGSADGGSRRESATGIWGSWRHGSSANGADGGQRENGPLSGYQPAGRGGRGMKVLKSAKASSSSARTGAAYEPPPPPPRSSGEYRRKSQATSAGQENGSAAALRWDTKRSASSAAGASGGEAKPAAGASPPLTATAAREGRDGRDARGIAAPLPRSANPIGGASAFSWMTPLSKGKAPATATTE